MEAKKSFERQLSTSNTVCFPTEVGLDHSLINKKSLLLRYRSFI